MPRIPRDTSFDATLALIRDPYGFVSQRCRRYGSDLFETRLMLRKTICMTGPEAAALFYDQNRFIRRGATPGRIQKTLFGRGGVQGLDDEAHRHRKRMLMSLMTQERIGRLADLTAGWWRAYARKWAMMEEVVLYDEVRELLTRAVCAWAGVPLDEAEVGPRTRQLTALFDGAGSVGPKHWRSRLARKQAERWIVGIVEQVRAVWLDPPKQSPASVIAWHRDSNGELLSPRVAAVELLNVLRPTVAVSVYIVFVAHALHQYPECRRKLQAGEDGYPELFVQEIRRFYPFFLPRGRGAGATRLRVERLPVPAAEEGAPGPARDQPRPANVGRAGGVPAGAVPPVGPKSFQFHTPGRRRPFPEPPVRG